MSVVNLTVLRLAVTGSYEAAFFSPATRNGAATFSAYGCRTRRFFDSFFSSTSMIRLNIRSSRFESFQNTAIALETEWRVDNEGTRIRRVLEPDSVGLAIVNECVFLEFGGCICV